MSRPRRGRGVALPFAQEAGQHRVNNERCDLPHANRADLRWICSVFPLDGFALVSAKTPILGYLSIAEYASEGSRYFVWNAEQIQRKFANLRENLVWFPARTPHVRCTPVVRTCVEPCTLNRTQPGESPLA